MTQESAKKLVLPIVASKFSLDVVTFYMMFEGKFAFGCTSSAVPDGVPTGNLTIALVDESGHVSFADRETALDIICELPDPTEPTE